MRWKGEERERRKRRRYEERKGMIRDGEDTEMKVNAYERERK